MKKTIIFTLILTILLLGCTQPRQIGQIPVEYTTDAELQELSEFDDVDEEDFVEQENIEEIQRNEILEEELQNFKEQDDSKKIVIFHNGVGPQSKAALLFLDKQRLQYPDLVLEKYLTSEDGISILLGRYINTYRTSIGLSDEFNNMPIIFINEKGYSGFDDNIQFLIGRDIEQITK